LEQRGENEDDIDKLIITILEVLHKATHPATPSKETSTNQEMSNSHSRIAQHGVHFTQQNPQPDINITQLLEQQNTQQKLYITQLFEQQTAPIIQLLQQNAQQNHHITQLLEQQNHHITQQNHNITQLVQQNMKQQQQIEQLLHQNLQLQQKFLYLSK